MTKQNCQTCKFIYVGTSDDPCDSCIPHWAGRGPSAPHPGWQPRSPEIEEEPENKESRGSLSENIARFNRLTQQMAAKEERLQAQVDTYRQALNELMDDYQKNGLITRVIWYRCKRLLDGSEPMPARSAAQCIDLLMQENEGLLAERDEARKVAKHIYENKQLIFKYAWLEP